ncbi:MAG: hypothetical protein NZL85_00470 [Fimbriimonadales bacterium]|nr:hypothetical protein [Fimbriimonadales bacterium]
MDSRGARRFLHRPERGDAEGSLVPTAAEAERRRAEQALQQAELERQRAEAERQRAERLAQRLRELGYEPE